MSKNCVRLSFASQLFPIEWGKNKKHFLTYVSVIFLSSSFFTSKFGGKGVGGGCRGVKKKKKKHPSSSCHINDTIASDVEIALDSELPRRRCVGLGPSRLRLGCQTTEQSFGKHWQHAASFVCSSLFNLAEVSVNLTALCPETPTPTPHPDFPPALVRAHLEAPFEKHKPAWVRLPVVFRLH